MLCVVCAWLCGERQREGVSVIARLNYWTGLLDWTTGLDYWTAIVLCTANDNDVIIWPRASSNHLTLADTPHNVV